jgi:hypothetical protein
MISPDTTLPPVSVPLRTSNDKDIASAAESLRVIEVDAAANAEPSGHKPTKLASLTIDELRNLASALGVPHRSTITDRHKLIEAIRARF